MTNRLFCATLFCVSRITSSPISFFPLPAVPFPFWVSPHRDASKFTWSPFCNPFVFKFMHVMGGVPPLGVCTFRLRTFPRVSELFPFFSYSYALFCTHQNHNSFVFKRFRTLCAKHPGGRGVSITSGRLCFCGKDLSAPNWRLQTDHCQLSKREEMGTGARGAPVPEVGR